MLTDGSASQVLTASLLIPLKVIPFAPPPSYPPKHHPHHHHLATRWSVFNSTHAAVHMFFKNISRHRPSCYLIHCFVIYIHTKCNLCVTHLYPCHQMRSHNTKTVFSPTIIILYTFPVFVWLFDSGGVDSQEFTLYYRWVVTTDMHIYIAGILFPLANAATVMKLLH